VAQCERQKLPNCRSYIAGVETQTTFARSRGTQVVAVVFLKGLESSRRYEVQGQLVDPRGDRRARVVYVWDLPREVSPDFHLDVSFTWSFPSDPRAVSLGRWRIEIAVNGIVEGERTFEVIEEGTGSMTWAEEPLPESA
jgi:hypothetical protein